MKDGFGRLYFLISNFAPSPIPMDENESNTPILMYRYNAVLNSLGIGMIYDDKAISDWFPRSIPSAVVANVSDVYIPEN